MSQFYDDMFERLEEVADRAALVRYRVACPKVTEDDVQEFWQALVRHHNRAYARCFLDRCLDMHEAAVARGEPGLFDEYGEVEGT